MIMFFVGAGGLWFIPTFHRITLLPPFLGAMCVLSLLWIVNELCNRTLLGSDQMVRNVLSYGVELEQAVYMAAESPRKYVNYYVPKFDIGEQADYNVIDENGNVLATLFGQRKNINNRS